MIPGLDAFSTEQGTQNPEPRTPNPKNLGQGLGDCDLAHRQLCQNATRKIFNNL